MAKKIAIASGKGGTGKTTISVNLFRILSREQLCSLVDCDVEEPNTPLFFPQLPMPLEQEVALKVAQIDPEKCTLCRKCVAWCEFNAITVIPPVSFARIDESLCHSCGACLYACSDGAIFEKPSTIGHIHSYPMQFGNNLQVGNLKIGSAMQTSMIRELKRKSLNPEGITIYDAPPGTSCPVVETMSGADLVILVTEPTPFGLHDLTLAVDLVRELAIPFGVVINKAGLGFSQIYDYLTAEKIELYGEIPFSKSYASLYSNGTILTEIPDEMEAIYLMMAQKILQKLSE